MLLWVWDANVGLERGAKYFLTSFLAFLSGSHDHVSQILHKSCLKEQLFHARLSDSALTTLTLVFYREQKLYPHLLKDKTRH